MRAILTIIFVIVTRTISQVCNHENSVELKNRSYNGIKYEDGQYFVDNTTGVERGCVCMKELCARKCCPFGQGYDQVTKTCVNVPGKFDPPVWDRTKLIPGFNASKEFHFLFYKMNCSRELKESRIPIGGSGLEFHLVTNGNLHVEIEKGTTHTYGPDKYCIDNFVMGDPTSNESSTELSALICFTSEEPEANHYALSSSCMLISCFFIILTVAVYAWVPELRNLHGMVLMAYLLSFFVGFLFLAAMQILLLEDKIEMDMCTAFTFVIYYSLLSAFFWMNIMSYDIWWTFSGKRMSSGRKSARARFAMYSLYAFGVPTIMTILLAILEFTVPPDTSHLLPRIRKQGCFLYKQSKFIYLYLPIVLLCVANLVFFTLTALKIAQIKKQTEVLNKKDEQRFTLYIKLFVLMGVNWILEVISSFYPKADCIWQFTDAYNVLVGLIIFIIFVCKRKTFNLIKKRVKDCQCSTRNVEETRAISSKKLSRWQNSKGIRASIDTIKTTLGFDTDSKSMRYQNSSGLPLSRTQTTSTSISTRTFSQSKDEMQLNSTGKK